MEITELIIHIDAFHREFNIDTSPDARFNKLIEETCELICAVQNESSEAADDEAIDVLVCAISNVVARGIVNPLDACYFKLQRTAAKYRSRNREI